MKLTYSEEKVKALAKFLDCQVEQIGIPVGFENEFLANGGEYIVLTDEEADAKAREYILDSLWSFNSEFIVSHANKRGQLDSDSQGILVGAIKKMQEKYCESVNPIIKTLIDDLDYFVDSAIAADGRGHFIAPYDSKEHEEGDYFIYRTN